MVAQLGDVDVVDQLGGCAGTVWGCAGLVL
jgi:hypothetical protein